MLTGVGPAGPEREAQIGSEMTMQHLHPGLCTVMRTWRGKHWPGTENATVPRFCVQTKGSFRGSGEGRWLLFSGL